MCAHRSVADSRGPIQFLLSFDARAIATADTGTSVLIMYGSCLLSELGSHGSRLGLTKPKRFNKTPARRRPSPTFSSRLSWLWSRAPGSSPARTAAASSSGTAPRPSPSLPPSAPISRPHSAASVAVEVGILEFVQRSVLSVRSVATFLGGRLGERIHLSPWNCY
jgi:hypothetical protein